MLKMALSAEAIEAASQRIRGHCHRTPVLSSESVNTLVNLAADDENADYNLFFKCENLQKTGSFKARGATNAVQKLVESRPNESLSVITHSSGNHGAALAYAARAAAVRCTVVAPDDAPAAKLDAIRSYGADVVTCEATSKAREATTADIMSRTGAHLVHPHNGYDVMEGQGTVAKELLEQCPQLDAIFVPIGGGGLASGMATWVRHAKPQCKVICVEPAGKHLSCALANDNRQWPATGDTLRTIADGMRVGHVGDNGFAVLRQCIQHEHVLTVTDDEIKAAMKLIYQRMKLVVEPSGATCLAAALKPDCHRLLQPMAATNIGVVICGGNVDFDTMGTLLR